SISYPGKDDADLINVLASIEEADIALIFIEQPNGNIKVSWRAKPGFDVSQVALHFGGGGHKPAAGAEIVGTLETVQAEVIEATRDLLNGKPE
ncbi:MAG: DHHA1 domain-containing protein, partial [Anaerolineales bacterium]